MDPAISISDDKNLLDIPYIHAVLSQTYWADWRSLEQVKHTIETSVCFGVYSGQKQIGFARVLSDQVVFAYLMDVFIDEAYQHQGYASRLMEFVIAHDSVKSVKKFLLMTKDAHLFYEKFGFGPHTDPNRIMEINR